MRMFTEEQAQSTRQRFAELREESRRLCRQSARLCQRADDLCALSAGICEGARRRRGTNYRTDSAIQGSTRHTETTVL